MNPNPYEVWSGNLIRVSELIEILGKANPEARVCIYTDKDPDNFDENVTEVDIDEDGVPLLYID